uniref:Endothelin-3 n=1 Tax=Oryzias latipes TaxID=8090 RepID=A0A3P9IYU7_ORYLA
MTCFLARILFFETLTLILLQGVLMSHDDLESNPRLLRDAQEFDSRGSQLSETTKSRQKRCTCYSYTDKECVYYCHLDIIWINTPERTVPYGMSSYIGQQRSRRAARARLSEREGPKTPRCICAATDKDAECQDFCWSNLRQTPQTRNLHRVSGLGQQLRASPSDGSASPLRPLPFTL